MTRQPQATSLTAVEELRQRYSAVTIAHDYFTQRGGAERVAAALVNMLHPDLLVTAAYEREKTFAVDNRVALRKLLPHYFSIFRKDPRKALLVLPSAWAAQRRIRKGIVLCSSSGWAHALPVRRSVVKVVYCHNPARWLYQPHDYFKDSHFALKIIMCALRPLLLAWDQRAAKSASLYIANSNAVAQRIKSAYGITAAVIPPPLTLNDEHRDNVRPLEIPFDEYFLTVGRDRGYKNVATVRRAFEQTVGRSLVIVGGDVAADTHNVRSLTDVSDQDLQHLYRNCQGLVTLASEDFGLTPLEANSFGKPVVVLRAGGFIDSTIEGKTGLFVESVSATALKETLQEFDGHQWDVDFIKAHAAAFSLESFIDRLVRAVLNIGQVQSHAH